MKEITIQKTKVRRRPTAGLGNKKIAYGAVVYLRNSWIDTTVVVIKKSDFNKILGDRKRLDSAINKAFNILGDAC